ncbi:hypothetical protein M378DRAFT_84604 [Amanita muscaria Koide BX008]|uniref:Uncharacterized protein n=1 Tax=Amanita muscaria (strain Koide BX008) TaxID=946122 RepID=A0A0C2SAJ9_AMAMK|nr:hypothetical protein M378DRAFT_84604 [Amanita muscaria Koide BX008]
MVSSQSMSSQDRSLAEIIGIPFPEFDHKNEVIDPFAEDENRDQAFKEELTEMLLDAFIETHAWSTARLKHESLAAAEKFEAGISNIMEIQQDQGTLTSSLSLSSSPSVSPSVASNPSSISVFGNPRFVACMHADGFVCETEQTRQRLNEFIGRIRNAIAALTNTMLL